MLVLALGACRVDVLVRVDLKENGSGEVTVGIDLDADAVRAATVDGGTLDTRVRLDGLAESGWRISGWKETDNGGAALELKKPFSKPSEASAWIRELNGPSGPIRDLRVTRDAGPFRSEWSFRAVADRRALDLAISKDPELVARLTNERVDVKALEESLAKQADDSLHLRVTAFLPDAKPKTVSISQGDRAVVKASSTDLDFSHVIMLVVAIGAAALAIVLVIKGESRTRQSRGTL